MSGGSMDYIYSRLEMDATFSEHTPERRAFAKHLQLVVKALHDIEWVDSSDYGPGGESEAIQACLREGAALEAAIEDAHAAEKTLREELENACSGKRRHNAEAQLPAWSEAECGSTAAPCYVPTRRIYDNVTAATKSNAPSTAKLSASKPWRQPENHAFELPFIEPSLKR